MENYGYVYVTPDVDNGQFDLNISEIEKPFGFTSWLHCHQAEHAKTITVKYNSSYEVSDIVISSEDTPYFAKHVSEAGNVYVRVKNHTRLTKIKIIKQDTSGNPLPGVKFNLYFNNITYIKLPGEDKLYFVNQKDYEDMAAEVDGDENLDILTPNVEQTIGGLTLKRVSTENGDSNRLWIYGITTNSNGEIQVPEIMMGRTSGYGDAINVKGIITIYEEEVPNGYEKLSVPLKLMVRYNLEDEMWELIERDSANETIAPGEINTLSRDYWSLDNSENNLKITIKNEPITSLQLGGTGYGFYKIAKATTTRVPIEGAVFKATFTQDSWSQTLYDTSDPNGWISFAAVQPPKTTDVKAVVTEETAPTGWYIPENKNKKEITYRYDSIRNLWYAVGDSTVRTVLSADGKVTHSSIPDVPNPGKIEKLTIFKTDQLRGTPIDGMIFELTFSNVDKVGGVNATGNSVTIERTVTDGKIEIPEIVMHDLDQNLEVKIEETETIENYKKINGVITLEFKRVGDNLYLDRLDIPTTILPTEFNSNDIVVKTAENEIELNIRNHEVIELSGRVWLDAQQNFKDAAAPDGYAMNNSNEKPIDKLKVYSYSIEELEGVNRIQSVLTNNGEYSFDSLIRTNSGYKIVFEYNGILYDDVGIYRDSDAKESSNEDRVAVVDELGLPTRETFNSNFKTIEKDKSQPNGTTLQYNYSGNSSKLYLSNGVDIQSAISGTVARGETYREQAIGAGTTTVYTETTENIDCGLISKYYDWRIDNLVESIEYTINGKKLEESPVGSENEEER